MVYEEEPYEWEEGGVAEEVADGVIRDYPDRTPAERA